MDDCEEVCDVWIRCGVVPEGSRWSVIEGVVNIMSSVCATVRNCCCLDDGGVVRTSWGVAEGCE